MRLAVIPARGGSKRIPRKNVRSFSGKPIISYSIRAALESGVFDEVIVSTDDQEIAEVAKEHGASVPFIRPPEIADDYAVIAEVMAHAVEWYESQGSKLTEACCVYATAPMVNPADIAKGLKPIIDGTADYALSVCTFPFPIQRALKMDHTGAVAMINPEHALTRSQDLEECYHDAAQFYWGSADAFKGKLKSTTTAGIVVPRYTVQDIDTEEDWRQAELIYKAFIG